MTLFEREKAGNPALSVKKLFLKLKIDEVPLNLLLPDHFGLR